jgi:hypothetical protein
LKDEALDHILGEICLADGMNLSQYKLRQEYNDQFQLPMIQHYTEEV